jgi:hypothetical protein
VAQTVLDTVLDQLALTPSEYFIRLEESLDEARQQRLHRVSASRETAALIQEEVAAPELTMLRDEDADELTFTEPGEEEPLTTGVAGPGRARPRKSTRARAARSFDVVEEDEELGDLAVESLDDDESQFKQAYRRAMRTNRRPFRDR